MTNKTKEEIFRIAQTVFEEKGYRRATVREICSRANVNIASIKYHYGDKRELFRAVVEQMLFTHLPDVVPVPFEIIDQQSMLLALKNWIDGFLWQLTTIRPQIAGIRMFAYEFLERSEVCSDLYEHNLRGDVERLETILRYGLDDKEIGLKVYAILGECLFYVHYEQLARIHSGIDNFMEKNSSKIAEQIYNNAAHNLKFRKLVE